MHGFGNGRVNRQIYRAANALKMIGQNNSSQKLFTATPHTSKILFTENAMSYIKFNGNELAGHQQAIQNVLKKKNLASKTDKNVRYTNRKYVPSSHAQQNNAFILTTFKIKITLHNPSSRQHKVFF